MVNVTNLTSSFRSGYFLIYKISHKFSYYLLILFKCNSIVINIGIAFAVILKHFVPNRVELSQFNPRMAKNNLRIVIESYANAGLDLSAVINVNETASKDWILKTARVQK